MEAVDEDWVCGSWGRWWRIEKDVCSQENLLCMSAVSKSCPARAGLSRGGIVGIIVGMACECCPVREGLLCAHIRWHCVTRASTVEIRARGNASVDKQEVHLSEWEWVSGSWHQHDKKSLITVLRMCPAAVVWLTFSCCFGVLWENCSLASICGSL